VLPAGTTRAFVYTASAAPAALSARFTSRTTVFAPTTSEPSAKLFVNAAAPVPRSALIASNRCGAAVVPAPLNSTVPRGRNAPGLRVVPSRSPPTASVLSGVSVTTAESSIRSDRGTWIASPFAAVIGPYSTSVAGPPIRTADPAVVAATDPSGRAESPG